MPSPYGDSRRNMHPGIAASVPHTPEAIALLHERQYVPHTFGGLVTKLVENGSVDGQTLDAARFTTCELLGIAADDFDHLIKQPDLLSPAQTDRWIDTIGRRKRKAVHEANVASWQQHLTERAMGISQDPHIEQVVPLVAEQELRTQVAYASYDSADLPQRQDAWRTLETEVEQLTALEASRFAITVDDLLEVLRYDQHTQSSFATYAEKSELYRALAAELEKLRGLSLPNLAAWELGDDEAASDTEDLEQKLTLHSIWLAEADVALLAVTLVKQHELTKAWRERPKASNPLEEILRVQPEQIRLFNEAFPVRHGQAPLAWLLLDDQNS